MPSILIAEDELKLALHLKTELIENAFEVEIAYDGNSAEKLIAQHEYNLIVLDINIPFQNGFELCKKIRQRNKDIPIIMLTALGELDNKMTAFELGADDYIIKPFHFKELLARINVFLKRSNNAELTVKIISVSDLEIDCQNKIVKRSNKEIILTSREFTLLELLMRSNGRVISKAEIMEKVWNINFETNSNTIEVYINFLRNKIDKPYKQKLIHTKPGFGYYIKEQP